ncbi:MAG: TRAP transporter large permease [Chloroflexi bacterium]|nr:TRAP transporter large permease [Chloroflexota bacterium]
MEIAVVGLSFVLFAFLIIWGIPIGFAMGVAGFLGLLLSKSPLIAISFSQQVVFASTYGYTLAIVPLFIFMGNLLGGTDIMPTLFNLLQRVFGRVRGGLAHIVILLSAIFGACSGSSVAACGVFTPITLPSMEKLGYKRSFSAGCIASSATVAVMIPPSITMVIYGIITETSIGPLLIAGIIPGILNTALYMLTVVALVTLKPELAPLKATREQIKAERLQPGQVVIALTSVGVVVLAVMGGIYSGLFTPSQAGAVGAFVAFLIYLARKTKLPTSRFGTIIGEVAAMTAVIFVILIGATLFARFLELSGFISIFVDFVRGLSLPSLGIYVLIVFIYLLLGQVFDPMSMLVLTLPVFFPLVTEIGFDPIWFGVIVVQLVEIGALTPPMGLNVFTVSAATKGLISPEEAFKGVMPFVITCLGMIALLTAFPAIALWLPSKMIP